MSVMMPRTRCDIGPPRQNGTRTRQPRNIQAVRRATSSNASVSAWAAGRAPASGPRCRPRAMGRCRPGRTARPGRATGRRPYRSPCQATHQRRGVDAREVDQPGVDHRDADRAAQVAQQVVQARGVLQLVVRHVAQRHADHRHHGEQHRDAAHRLRPEQLPEPPVGGSSPTSSRTRSRRAEDRPTSRCAGRRAAPARPPGAAERVMNTPAINTVLPISMLVKPRTPARNTGVR